MTLRIAVDFQLIANMLRVECTTGKYCISEHSILFLFVTLTTLDEGRIGRRFPKVDPASEYRGERRQVLNRNEVAMVYLVSFTDTHIVVWEQDSILHVQV